MKTAVRLLVYLITIVAFAVTAPSVWSARAKKRKQFIPPPTPTPPGAPSTDLSSFVGANLEKVLGPLEVKVPMPRAELAQLRASFASRFSKASLAERPQSQAALAVCDALSQAMDERDKAMLNPSRKQLARNETHSFDKTLSK